MNIYVFQQLNKQFIHQPWFLKNPSSTWKNTEKQLLQPLLLVVAGIINHPLCSYYTHQHIFMTADFYLKYHHGLHGHVIV